MMQRLAYLLLIATGLQLPVMAMLDPDHPPGAALGAG